MHAVALDFDGTVADSMGFLTELAEAARQYLATAGSEFATQLDELAPGHPRLAEVASRFEAEKTRWMGCCEMFTDIVPAVERLAAAGVPVLLCSSTRVLLVRDFCERYGLLQRFASVDGWGPRHRKSVQLVSGVAAAGFAGHEVVFVGDTRRDGDVAGPQARGSSAWSVQDTPTPSPAAAPRSWARCPSWPATSSKPPAPR